MREQQVQSKIIKWLEEDGHYIVKVISATKAGVPDILCCINGAFVAIEVKTEKTKDNVSPLQKYNLEKIELSGGHQLVAWSLEMVKDYLREKGLI